MVIRLIHKQETKAVYHHGYQCEIMMNLEHIYYLFEVLVQEEQTNPPKRNSMLESLRNRAL